MSIGSLEPIRNHIIADIVILTQCQPVVKHYFWFNLAIMLDFCRGSVTMVTQIDKETEYEHRNFNQV